MIEFLSVRDFALVESLEVEFGPGLTLMTGETGAGKSILIDALSQLLGARGSKQLIRTGCSKARIEGLFRIGEGGPLSDLLNESGIVFEQGRLVVRRDLARSAGSRSFVNGTLVTQHFLKQVGALLVDIHGQHEQQTLLGAASHLKWIDAYGGLEAEAVAVADAFRQWNSAGRELARIRDEEGARLREVDHIRFQLADIETLGLRPELEEELVRDQALLASAETRSQNSHAAYDLLYDRDDALLSGLARLEKHVALLSSIDPNLEEASATIADCRIRLQDVAFQLGDYRDTVAFDPARLEQVEGHLSRLQAAQRRYGASVAQILEFQDGLQSRLRELLQSDDRAGMLEEEIERWHRVYRERASSLSSNRKAAARKLCEKVTAQLARLAMPAARFMAGFEEDDEPRERGIDRVEFAFSANSGEPPRPLAQVASGGELSRLSLALKSIVHLDSDAGTLVFDEVDAGIGGRTASALAERLERVAESHQVLCITHLPQIASVARHHFLVSKSESGGRTQVRVDHLSDEERVPELARMLAGSQASATTLTQARELLKRSDTPVRSSG